MKAKTAIVLLTGVTIGVAAFFFSKRAKPMGQVLTLRATETPVADSSAVEKAFPVQVEQREPSSLNQEKTDGP